MDNGKWKKVLTSLYVCRNSFNKHRYLPLSVLSALLLSSAFCGGGIGDALGDALGEDFGVVFFGGSGTGICWPGMNMGIGTGFGKLGATW